MTRASEPRKPPVILALAPLVVRGDARRLPLPDASVDLIVCSPPYFALRSYRDCGEHYEGQIGSEEHPQLWLEAMWGVMSECWRVLAPTGSVWVNLGDKRTGSGGHNNGAYGVSGVHKDRHHSPTRDAGIAHNASLRDAPDRYTQAAFGRAKSKMLLPHRFAIGCEDGLADPEGIGWIVRQDQVIPKLNGLPESVTDRTRDSHEMFFHLTKEGDYYSAVDELREPHERHWEARTNGGGRKAAPKTMRGNMPTAEPHASGALPGSVWEVSSQPLRIPDWAKAKFNLPDHYAAFVGGTELVRRIVLGWSPPAICLECGEGRRPVVEKHYTAMAVWQSGNGVHHRSNLSGDHTGATEATILGYACSCCPSHIEITTTAKHDDEECSGTIQVPTGEEDLFGEQRMEWADCTDPAHMVTGTRMERVYDLAGWTPPASRPAIVLDPFAGTGTTGVVAQALGRQAVLVDLSADYCRLAKWRCTQRVPKVMARTWAEAQGALL